VALVLEVAGPGEQLRVFSTDEFKPPEHPENWVDPDYRPPEKPPEDQRTGRVVSDAVLTGSASGFPALDQFEKPKSFPGTGPLGLV
jgi:hypothetical protein